MPPSTNSKKMGRPNKVNTSSSSKKKGKRSHSDFAGDDDDYNLFSINDATDSDEELPNPFTLDIEEDDMIRQSASQSSIHKLKKSNSMTLSPIRSDYLGSPSPKSGSLDHSMCQPNLTLAFNANTPLFDSIMNESVNQTNKPSIDHDMLKSLARELHQMQGEAKARALLVETELRNIYSSGNQTNDLILDGQYFYQEAIKYIHGIDVSDDPLDDQGRLIDVPKQRKRTDQSNNQSNNRSNNQSIDEIADPPKKQTEKQKAQELKESMEWLESYMSFPDKSINRLVRPFLPDRQPVCEPLGEYYLAAEAEARWKEERAKEKALDQPINQSAGQSKKEKKKEKERQIKQAAKEAKKFAEAQRLYLPYFDPKLRKSVVEMDRALNEKQSSSQSNNHLLNRLLACLVEPPVDNNQSINPPIRPYNAGPIPIVKCKKKKKVSRASMSIDERIKLELRALGLPTLAALDVESSLIDRSDDRLCAEIRSAHAEMVSTAESINSTRSLFYPLGCKIQDHGARLKGLIEAESTLTKAIKASKKKKSSDKAVHTAYDNFCNAEKRFGIRSQITGFIPNPAEMGGVPREIANKITNHPSYVQVLMSNNLPPLGQSNNDFHSYQPYKSSYSPAPMGSMGANSYASPLPSFASTSPLRLPGSPQPGRGDIDSMGDDFALSMGSITQPDSDSFPF